MNYIYPESDHIKKFKFPDGQTHVQVLRIYNETPCSVFWPIRDNDELIQLLQLSDALDRVRSQKKKLVIPYLMGARFDRVMQAGDSFDLKVIAQLINSCNFEKVSIFDVHSEVALALIENSTNFSNLFLVDCYNQPDAVLICPDAGAAKKSFCYMEGNENITDIAHCIKSRDLSNGNITLNVLDPEKCKGRNCVIIDDICDGGATFIAIAKQIQPKTLTLIVSHGIFSKGFNELENYFTEIIVSDSYKSEYQSNIVTTKSLSAQFIL
jgi:ribose-phosphate pyrophosphokinase